MNRDCPLNPCSEAAEKPCTCWRQVRWPIDKKVADDPHAKANLLIQAHLSALALPISDYITDTKTVLDNSIRILQARCGERKAVLCFPLPRAKIALNPVASNFTELVRNVASTFFTLSSGRARLGIFYIDA